MAECVVMGTYEAKFGQEPTRNQLLLRYLHNIASTKLIPNSATLSQASIIGRFTRMYTLYCSGLRLPAQTVALYSQKSISVISVEIGSEADDDGPLKAHLTCMGDLGELFQISMLNRAVAEADIEAGIAENALDEVWAMEVVAPALAYAFASRLAISVDIAITMHQQSTRF